MTISRRALLGAAGGLALGLGACTASGGGSTGGKKTADLRMAWWGNETGHG